jgi:hypothetical protein
MTAIETPTRGRPRDPQRRQAILDAALALVADAIRERHAETSQIPDTGSLRGDLLALVAIQTGQLLEDVHLACGLLSAMRTSPELAHVMQDHVIAEELVDRVLLPIANPENRK